MSENPVASARVPGFADALTRAKEIASKIRPVEDQHLAGSKRPVNDAFAGPDTKRSVGNFYPDMANPDMPGDGPPTETIMVPDKMVSFIIGRGGETIKRLQAETGCKIQMANDSQGMPERRCILTGMPQAIADAKAAIGQMLASEDSNAFGAPAMGGMNGGGERFEMMIPGNKVGMIIGKGGENIRNMQESTGAKIVIVQESAEFANEKPLVISGAPDSIERAKSMVYEILNQDDDDSQMMGGGRGRGRGRGMPMRGGPPFASRGFGRGGYDRGGGHGGTWQGPGGHRGDPSSYQEIVKVPSNKCGLVIGKGGETIIGINRSSGAHCEIDKQAPPDAMEKNFMISGTREAVEMAKQMILEKAGLQSGASGSSNGSWGGQYQDHGGHRPDQGAGMNPSGNQGDFSAQWIDFYRKMGMTRDAEAIERSTAARSNPSDYSAQWAEYYRSVGKHDEAAAIEAQMKTAASAGYQGAVYGGASANQPGYPAYRGYVGYQPSDS